jgi:hypothetical protein
MFIPLTIKREVAIIPLGRGYFAKVDAGDFSLVSSVKWRPKLSKRVPTVYAVAWSKHTRGEQRRFLQMHRIVSSAADGVDVDHKDLDGLNNTRVNLRVCARSQNQWNQGKQRRKCVSMFKGVDWHAKSSRWRARNKVHGRRIYLGKFKTEIEAAAAYNRAAEELHGEFARPNLI